jgi:hypothetical protein
LACAACGLYRLCRFRLIGLAFAGRVVARLLRVSAIAYSVHALDFSVPSSH